jgi:hypothetical protein
LSHVPDLAAPPQLSTLLSSTASRRVLRRSRRSVSSPPRPTSRLGHPAFRSGALRQSARTRPCPKLFTTRLSQRWVPQQPAPAVVTTTSAAVLGAAQGTAHECVFYLCAHATERACVAAIARSPAPLVPLRLPADTDPPRWPGGDRHSRG